MMGTWSGATDGFDEYTDNTVPITGSDGYVGIWHESGAAGWNGPTGFYGYDMRAPLAPGETKTWSRLYLWADPTYVGSTMRLALAANEFLAPPGQWEYTLALVEVPKDVAYPEQAPRLWTVPVAGELDVSVPTYKTSDPLTGYEFAFTMRAVPEPAGVAALLALGLTGLRRR